MDREFSISAKAYALTAVASLSFIARQDADWESEEMKRFKKAIGLIIGRIEADVLRTIYNEYTDLDDIAGYIDESANT